MTNPNRIVVKLQKTLQERQYEPVVFAVELETYCDIDGPPADEVHKDLIAKSEYYLVEQINSYMKGHR